MIKETFIDFFKILGWSILLFLITCWSAWKGFWIAALVESFCYLYFTFRMCKKYECRKLSVPMIVTAIIIGRMLLEIPVRIYNFYGSVISISVPVICIASIFMGVLCYRKNIWPVWMACVLCIVIYSLFVPEMWFQYWKEYVKPLM